MHGLSELSINNLLPFFKRLETGQSLGFETISLVAVSQSGNYWDKNNFQEYLNIPAEKKKAIIAIMVKVQG